MVVSSVGFDSRVTTLTRPRSNCASKPELLLIGHNLLYEPGLKERPTSINLSRNNMEMN
jgi:hypothetical protein